jgi:hypothetical protein
LMSVLVIHRTRYVLYAQSGHIERGGANNRCGVDFESSRIQITCSPKPASNLNPNVPTRIRHATHSPAGRRIILPSFRQRAILGQSHAYNESREE